MKTISTHADRSDVTEACRRFVHNVDYLESNPMVDNSKNMEIILSNIVTSCHLWEYWISPEGTVTHVSPACEAITGYKPSEFINTPDLLLKIIHPQDQPKMSEKFRSEMNRQSYESEFRIITRSGAVRWLEHSAGTVVSDSNVLLGTRVINRDITAHREAQQFLELTNERLQRSNQDLEQFAYVAAHDLREPLVAVAAYLKIVERLARNEINGRAGEYVTRATDLVLKMDSMLQGFLSYSRYSVANGSTDATDANACLNEALSNLAFSVKKSGVSISSDQLPSVSIPASQLLVIFQNLIGNSIKFRKSEPLKVHVGCVQLGSFNQFHVSDNGMGIEPPYLKRIFRMFDRGQGISEPSGTGIGLAICSRIVERYGGSLWVDSKPGQGSTFYFTLPVVN